MSKRAEKELLPLYIKLYFDEDVSSGIVDNLRQRGFDVLCAHEADMLSRDDDAQLNFAISQKRTFVTHNRHDFELKHYEYLETGKEHYGIIIARRRQRDEGVVARLLALLNSITAEEMILQLRYI